MEAFKEEHINMLKEAKQREADLKFKYEAAKAEIEKKRK